MSEKLLGISQIDVDRQLPLAGELFLDHVGHFVRDVAAASSALSRMGFAPTPVSIQVNHAADGTASPTGTGNVTAMLRHGYIEVLFKTAETPLGREFDAALSSYAGVRLVAFGTDDAAREHHRLSAAHFNTRPLVALRRPVETQNGNEIAAFTVARVAPEDMPEGRIQLLTHHTENAVWQPRWLDHPNAAQGLLDVLMIVEDVEQTAARFARFLGRQVTSNALGSFIKLDRGGVMFIKAAGAQQWLGAIDVPLPFIAGYGVRVPDLALMQQLLKKAGMRPQHRGDVMLVPYPEELGRGFWFMVEDAAALPWRNAA